MADSRVQLNGRPASAHVLQPAQPPPATGAADTAGQLEADRQALASARQALAAAAKEFEGLQQEILKQAEGHVVMLAVDIARKVLMQEIEAERYQIDAIVKEALAQLPPRQEVVVHLNPADIARCELAADDADGSDGNLRFVADPAVSKGGCLLASSQGVVESSVEGNLGEIANNLSTQE